MDLSFQPDLSFYHQFDHTGELSASGSFACIVLSLHYKSVGGVFVLDFLFLSYTQAFGVAGIGVGIWFAVSILFYVFLLFVPSQ